jgi:hypothetical protein
MNLQVHPHHCASAARMTLHPQTVLQLPPRIA